jgi:hypothetical protein
MYWCDYKWRKRLSSSAIESTAAKLLAWRESVVSEDPHTKESRLEGCL